MGYRYIGAKTRIVGEILPRIGEVVGHNAHIADLMCGTAAVSSELRQNGYQVTANDLMTFCFHHARVALLFQSSPSFSRAQDFVGEYSGLIEKSLFPLPRYEAMLAALNAVQPQKGFFWREYSQEGRPLAGVEPRNYFSPRNAEKIDGVRTWIRELKRTGKLTDLEHSLLIHDLIMAANDVANIAGTYGHYLSKSVERARETFTLKPAQLLLKKDKAKHTVLRGYAEEVAKDVQCDLCYIDPPYMKRQYAANYHILETLAREDEPEAVGASGLRPWRDQYSNFCTKTRIRDSFRKIFSEMKCPHFLISYSEDGLLTLTELENLVREFGVVDVVEFRHKRFRSNNSPLHSSLTEYLIHLRVI
jgi:adenine-specific DNA-methyltransferase